MWLSIFFKHGEKHVYCLPPCNKIFSYIGHKTEVTLLINQLYIMIPMLWVLKVISLHTYKRQIRLLIICFLGRWYQIAEYFFNFPTMTSLNSSLCHHITLGKGQRKGDHFQPDGALFTISRVIISVCFFLGQHLFIKVTDNISDAFLFISPSCFSFLPFLASSSFKNHFTLGKTRRHMPMRLSVCWMARDQRAPSTLPSLCEAFFTRGPVLCFHGPLVSHASIGVDIFLHPSGFSPVQSPDLTVGRVQGTHTHTHTLEQVWIHAIFRA